MRTVLIVFIDILALTSSTCCLNLGMAETKFIVFPPRGPSPMCFVSIISIAGASCPIKEPKREHGFLPSLF